MKKFSMTLIAVLMFAFSAFADVNSVLAGLEKIKSYTADFVQTTEIEGFGEDEYSGKLYIISGEHALWDYSKPYRQFYLFDTETMQYYDSDTRQLIVQNLDPAANVFMRLMLNPADIRKDFDVKLEGDRLVLTPQADLGIADLAFTVKNGVITRIVTKDQNGNNTNIELKNISLDKALDAKLFTPEIPEGTEVFRY